MTFRVERPTPGRLLDHDHGPVNRSLRLALPFEVEVLDKPEKRTDWDSTCRCETVVRITDDGVRSLKKRGLFREALAGQPNPVICNCMGRFL